jgi:hypothetical protein
MIIKSDWERIVCEINSCRSIHRHMSSNIYLYAVNDEECILGVNLLVNEFSKWTYEILTEMWKLEWV